MNNILSSLLACLILILTTSTATAKETVSSAQRELRLQHAHELLGKYYRKSAVRVGEKVTKINSMIYRWTRERLPSKYRKDYKKIAQAIIDESLKHEFDPVFLLSVIQGESSFNPRMHGALDEIGLMQIRPGTAEWISKKAGLTWKGKDSLYDPVTNIRIGAVFLAHLREQFDSHAQLYLAAYNMGARNVASARERDVWPKDYPIHVMKLYVEFYSDIEVSDKNAAKI